MALLIFTDEAQGGIYMVIANVLNIYTTVAGLWQYDYGQIIRLQGIIRFMLLSILQIQNPDRQNIKFQFL